MVLELIFEIMSQMQQINSVLLIVIFLIFIILAYKLFQTMIRAVIVGVIAAAFPFVANYFGFSVPITLNSILWFAITGVVLFLAYSFISGGIKIVKIVLTPFKWLFRKKEKKK